ncbi:hypothetical protein IJT93_08720 [bacterium]|nr:hypothetical protein [bacterium]
MKRFLFIFGGVALLVAVVLLIFPELRLGLFGVSLPQRLQKGRLDQVSCVSMLMNAHEIRGLSKDKSLEMDDDVQPDVYDLALGLLERVEIDGVNPVVNYQVKEENLAQVGVHKPSRILNNLFSLRLGAQLAPSGIELLKGQFSSVLDNVRFTQMLAPLWIVRPTKRVTVGEDWSGRFKLEYALNTLDNKRVCLEHRMHYAIEEIKPENDMKLAKINYKGEISFSPLDSIPEGTEVDCKGRIEGTALMNLESGAVILADDRTTWVYVVRHLQEELEELTLYDRKSRLFRPKFVPKGAAGFKSIMPEDGEAPDLEQVDNASGSGKAAGSGDKSSEKAK